jgi:hypothetical protein
MNQVSEQANTNQHSETLFNFSYACLDRLKNEENITASELKKEHPKK